jgi:DNA polymerase-4
VREVERVILHLDMDAFFASVEVRENPALAGKPVIIGHQGRRGVVATCSYEARTFGVHSAMPSITAHKLCPEAIWVHGRHSLYSEVSRSIRTIMCSVSPVVEPLSIDEAFIDLTGIARSLEEGAAIARQLKDRIHTQERLTSSVGLAPNKFLAKIASDLEKPDGLTLLPLDALAEKFWPLPIQRLWGVGPRSAERLANAGLHSIGDILQTTVEKLAEAVGMNSAQHLNALARGEDDREVKTERASKSISEERTYGNDMTDADEIDLALFARAEGIARQLRREGLEGRTVHLKVRIADFTTWTRSRTLPRPTDLAEPLLAAGRDLLANHVPLKGRGIRLLGLGVSSIQPAGTGQAELFIDPDEARARKLTDAADSVRNKLGEHTLTRARLLKPPE